MRFFSRSNAKSRAILSYSHLERGMWIMDLYTARVYARTGLFPETFVKPQYLDCSMRISLKGRF